MFVVLLLYFVNPVLCLVDPVYYCDDLDREEGVFCHVRCLIDHLVGEEGVFCHVRCLIVVFRESCLLL